MFFRFFLLLFTFLAFVCPSQAQESLDPVDQNDLDKLFLHRNLGRAYFEENKLAEAIQQFETCVKMAPNSAEDHINLGMAYLDYSKYAEAIREFEAARKIAPGYPHIYYNLALIYKRQTMYEESVEQFHNVLSLDENDPSTHFNLGIVYKRLKRNEAAFRAFRRTVELKPSHKGAHYILWRMMLRAGEVEEARREKEIFSKLQAAESSSEATASSGRALEEGKYTKLISFPPPKPTTTERPRGVSVRFVDATKNSGITFRPSALPPEVPKSLFSPSAASADYDNDGDIDLYFVHAGANRLYRNEGDGTFRDVTAQAGVGYKGESLSCAWGDYDNDGDVDLFVANAGANVLFRNEGHGQFIDVTQIAGVGRTEKLSVDALWVDYDHDGDLDLYVVNRGKTDALYRNNGNGTFTDVTAEAHLGDGQGQNTQVLPSDFDNDNDIDFLLVSVDGVRLYTNIRGNKFKDLTKLAIPAMPKGEHQRHKTAGILSTPLQATVGDYNNDGWMDILLATLVSRNEEETKGESKRRDLFYYRNKGNGTFVLETLNVGGTGNLFSSLDYDNDGYLDLFFASNLSSTREGAHGKPYQLLRNNGDGSFIDVSKETGLGDILVAESSEIITGDYDNDGDVEILLIYRQRPPILLKNEGGNKNHWIEVQLVGRENNRAGIASKIEVKAERFYQKRELFEPTILIGVGARTSVDVLRIKWPNGIIQNEIKPKTNQTFVISEKEGPAGSCPFLYVWNGKKFTFVTDFLDVGPVGVLTGIDTYLLPDSDEYVKIKDLQPKSGRYLLRVTEELREIVYLDALELLVIDYPANQSAAGSTKDVDIYPNEMFKPPPFPEPFIYVVKGARPPVAAFDNQGNDVLELISHRDRRYPNVRPLSYLGLAEPHSIILHLGDIADRQGGGRLLLMLTGWVNWGNASVNLAVDQNNQLNMAFSSLAVINQKGEWETVIPQLGFPAGIDKTAPIDLTGKFMTNDYRVKISTNLEIYWDQVLVCTDVEKYKLVNQKKKEWKLIRLKPLTADLHWRGYSKPYSPDGQQPLLYDYDTVLDTAFWEHSKGAFTRYGDVRALLREPDNQYVIMSHGDEISLSFDANALPSLRSGWKRNFILYSNGWIKDGDPNTAFSDTVAPLPFHGMSGYPYAETESYPFDWKHVRYITQYNTRQLR